jgi:DNA invertase Pin-like site-specific DNA recombinase
VSRVDPKTLGAEELEQRHARPETERLRRTLRKICSVAVLALALAACTIAATLGVSRATVYRVLAEQSDEGTSRSCDRSAQTDSIPVSRTSITAAQSMFLMLSAGRSFTST